MGFWVSVISEDRMAEEFSATYLRKEVGNNDQHLIPHIQNVNQHFLGHVSIIHKKGAGTYELLSLFQHSFHH